MLPSPKHVVCLALRVLEPSYATGPANILWPSTWYKQLVSLRQLNNKRKTLGDHGVWL
jgi:hypothetical protein